MHKSKALLIVVVAMSIVLIVLFLLLPKQPASALEKVVETDPKTARLDQAVELVNGAEPMKGIAILRELVAEDSTNADAQYYLGIFSVRSGQFPKAIERFEKVRMLKPDDIKYQVEIGYQYMVMDTAKLALECFERGLQIDSTDNNSLFFAAQAHERLGNKEEAVAKYRALLRHTSDTVVVTKVNEYIENIISNKNLNN